MLLCYKRFSSCFRSANSQTHLRQVFQPRQRNDWHLTPASLLNGTLTHAARTHTHDPRNMLFYSFSSFFFTIYSHQKWHCCQNTTVSFFITTVKLPDVNLNTGASFRPLKAQWHCLGASPPLLIYNRSLRSHHFL